jgi:hypothetical protein
MRPLAVSLGLDKGQAEEGGKDGVIRLLKAVETEPNISQQSHPWCLRASSQSLGASVSISQ